MYMFVKQNFITKIKEKMAFIFTQFCFFIQKKYTQLSANFSTNSYLLQNKFRFVLKSKHPISDNNYTDLFGYQYILNNSTRPEKIK